MIPAIILSKVVLPTPFLPIICTSCDGESDNETSLRTSFSKNENVSFLSSICLIASNTFIAKASLKLCQLSPKTIINTRSIHSHVICSIFSKDTSEDSPSTQGTYHGKCSRPIQAFPHFVRRWNTHPS